MSRTTPSALPIAEVIKSKEEIALDKIGEGESVIDMFNFREHYKNTINNVDSSFKWTI